MSELEVQHNQCKASEDVLMIEESNSFDDDFDDLNIEPIVPQHIVFDVMTGVTGFNEIKPTSRVHIIFKLYRFRDWIKWSGKWMWRYRCTDTCAELLEDQVALHEFQKCVQDTEEGVITQRHHKTTWHQSNSLDRQRPWREEQVIDIAST